MSTDYKPNWATRTIRDGKVRIEGRSYAPDGRYKEYDGRLDGLRYLFGIYRNDTRGAALDFVHLWGPAEYAKLDPDSLEAEEYPRPEIVDGHFPWDFWHVVEARNEQ